ncbi:oxidoreductase [Ralstonia soli]|uniref:Oxidoreductase n=1 Tax=Ralstonia soli TaxID=2953896 RepID=A0ABT1AE75_9RALS|nr:oxidoreductase [Ralstonia soli]MCO5396681.1 oxidoreductase [Ralstonia soli]
MKDQGKVWFITGASSGFGKALAEAALARGDRAVLAARRVERLEALAAEHGERALPVKLDVTDPAGRARAIDEAINRFGRIDVLANIAGRGSVGAVEEFAPEQLREQMEVNFLAPAELTRTVLPYMRAQGHGHVINLTSIGGLIVVAGFGAYCASKFALEAWSEALSYEVASLGIRVTLIEPGNFRTEFASDANMRPAQQLEPYRSVIAPIQSGLYGRSGRQPGDPAKAAKLMLAVADSDSPPLRLPLGTDAYEYWDRTVKARNADLNSWRERGSNTAFEDTPTDSDGGA